MNRNIRLVIFALAPLFQLTISQPSSAGTLYPIAISGQPAPDGNGIFGGQGALVLGFTAPILNNRGVVCFHANITGSSGAHAATGIFCGTPGLVTQVARGGQFPSVLGGGQFEGMESNSGAMNDAGQVAFKSGVTPVMGGGTDSVFRKGSGRDSFSLLARRGDPAPGEGNFGSILSSNWIPALSSAGHVAFFADLTDTNGGTADDTGIFRSSAAGDSVVRIVQEGDPVPGSSGTLRPHGTTPAVNASGEVAFKSEVLGVSGTTRHAIVRGDGQTQTLIANIGTPLPEAKTIWNLGTGTDVSMNSSGEVAFYVQTILSAFPFTQSTAALIGDSEANLTVVAKAGDRLTNFPGDLGRVDQHVMVNDAGQVAYLGSINADSGGALTALFRGKSVVAYNGLAPGGSGVSIIGMSNREFVINSAGKIAFIAQISIPGAANGFGIYVWDGAGNYDEVILHGAPLLGSTISGLEFAGTSGSVLQPGKNGFNDLGEVAFRFTLADEREGIALWSPLQKPVAGGGQIQPVASGFQVRFLGISGWDYVMERDEDLLPPWEVLPTPVRAGADGWITFDDLGPGLPAKRFYRMCEAP